MGDLGVVEQANIALGGLYSVAATSTGVFFTFERLAQQLPEDRVMALLPAVLALSGVMKAVGSLNAYSRRRAKISNSRNKEIIIESDKELS